MSQYFKYPSDLAAKLRERWGQQTWRGTDIEALPSDEILLPLIETCYFASLTAEEGRPTTFRAVVAGPTVTVDPLKFSNPIPLNVQALRRLAPAVTGQEIGLHLGPTFADCTVWGVASGSYALGLQLHVAGPGCLHVGHPVTAWLTLSGGAVDDDGGGTRVEARDVFDAAFREFISRVANPNQEALYLTPFESLTAVLLRGPSEFGHGGAIFVVPEREASGEWRQHARIKYPCDHNAAMSHLLALVDENVDYVDSFSRAQNEMRRIARLTLVDGAVVLTDKFRVLGFGVEFTAPPTAASGETVVHRGTVRPVQDFGTRHRSAFRFVAAYPQVTGFVCSQDGGIRCVRNVEGRVHLFD